MEIHQIIKCCKAQVQWSTLRWPSVYGYLSICNVICTASSEQVHSQIQMTENEVLLVTGMAIDQPLMPATAS